MSGDIYCKCCGWAGFETNLARGKCPVCHVFGCPVSDIVRADGTPYQPVVAAVAPPPSILDAAIAAGSALDPLGSRKPVEQLRVRSFAEEQADRERLAEHFRKNGVL